MCAQDEKATAAVFSENTVSVLVLWSTRREIQRWGDSDGDRASPVDPRFPGGHVPVRISTVVSGPSNEEVVGVVQGEDVALPVDLPVELQVRDEEMGDVDDSPLPTERCVQCSDEFG